MSTPYTPVFGTLRSAWSGTSGNRNTVSSVFVGARDATGSSNKNFRINILKHVNAGSDYSCHWCEVNEGEGAGFDVGISGINKGRSSSGTCSYLPVQNLSLLHLPTQGVIESQAIDKARNKVRSKSNSFKALVPLVELREFYKTVRSLTKHTHTTLELLDDISKDSHKRRARRRRRKNRGYTNQTGHVNRAADLWLTYSFGLKPLINDVESAAQSVAYKLNKVSESVFTTNTLSKSVSTAQGNVVAANASQYCVLKGVTQMVIRDQVGIHTGQLEKVFCQNDFKSIQNAFGLTPGDIVGAAWELIPYSWVVDYFTNIGTFLDNTFTNLPTQTYYCYITRKREVEYNLYVGAASSSPTGFRVGGRGSPAIVKNGVFTRQSLPQMPMSMLRVKSTDEIGLNSVNKLLNLASVFINRRSYS